MGRGAGSAFVFFGYGQRSLIGQTGHAGVGLQTRRPCSTKHQVTLIQSFFG